MTREFAASATREERLAVLDCCFAVSAADQDISPEEEAATLALPVEEVGAPCEVGL